MAKPLPAFADAPCRSSSALRGLRITFSGLLCLVVVLMVGLAALNSEANLLFLLFGISVGVVTAGAVGPVFMVRKLEIERVAPAAVVAGRSFSLAYVIRTRRRWFNSWSLTLGEVPVGRRAVRFPLAFLEVLRPGRPHRVEVTCLLPARGRVRLSGVRVWSRFPLGLFACCVDVDLPGELIVYPSVGRFRRDPWRDRRTADVPTQREGRRQRIETDEFYGVREYRPGDNLRWVHWRRSAHAGQLVVRESTPTRIQQLIVIVDPWPEVEKPGPEAAPPPARWLPRIRRRLVSFFRRKDGSKAGPWPAESVERAISLAATAVCDALERGHRVGLIARGKVPVVIAPSSGRPQRLRLLHELALLEADAGEGLDKLVSRVRWAGGWRGRCLLCATRANPTHSHVVRFLAARAESVTAITCDSDVVDAIFEWSPEGFDEAGPPDADRPAAPRRPRKSHRGEATARSSAGVPAAGGPGP